MDNLQLEQGAAKTLYDLLRRLRPLLGDQLVGMYVYGSLATGDYVPGRSDLDFLVVTDDVLPSNIVDDLESMHRTLADGSLKLAGKLEGAYVPRQVIRRHEVEHPAVPILNEGSFYLAPLGPDWDIQRYVIRKHDARLEGPPAVELIDPVEFSQVRRAISLAIDQWWEPMLTDPSPLNRPGYQPFAVISMCRALHASQHAELASKEITGRWASVDLDPRWQTLIEKAISWRDGDEIESIEDTVEFMRHAIALYRADLQEA